MKQFLLRVFLAAFLFVPAAWSQCSPTISCTGSTCISVNDPICQKSNHAVDLNSTEIKREGIKNNEASSVKGSEFIAPLISIPRTPLPAPSFIPSCAENNSCYGDISNITGKSKTVNVNGYYRRDGTYVRGYYRSR